MPWAAASGSTERVLGRRRGGFRLQAGHFAERFALIIIITGRVYSGHRRRGLRDWRWGRGSYSPPCSGWRLPQPWVGLLDLLMLVAERRLFAAKGEERASSPRDAYPHLHLPMVAGIILVALGIKQTLAHVGDPLGTIPAVALCGGVALTLWGTTPSGCARWAA